MATKETVWELEEHSIGKHLVLCNYLNAWLPIMSKYNQRLLIIDGFAGPGEYKGGQLGSPILALDALIAHKHQNLLSPEVVFYFIEKDPKRCDHLKSLIVQRYPSLPANVKVHITCGKFDSHMGELLDDIALQNKQLAPCFAMIDPFGVSDTPLVVMKKLLENSKCELYISLMYEFINRFKNSPEFEPHLDSLFGCQDWKEMCEIDNKEEKKSFLNKLYKKKLKESGAEQVVHFELYKGNRHVYTIFFATKHIKGSDSMKASIWKVVPEGDFKFKGGKDKDLLMSQDMHDFTSLQNCIQERFSTGQWITSKTVQDFVASDETDYHSSQVKKHGLKPLEEKGFLTIGQLPPGKKRRAGTYPPQILFRITAE